MRFETVVLLICLLALGWGCHSMFPRGERRRPLDRGEAATRTAEVGQTSAASASESYRTVESPPHLAGPDRQASRPARVDLEEVRMLPVADVVPGRSDAAVAAAGDRASGQGAVEASSSPDDAPSPGRGREKIARDGGRGSRSYRLEEKDDTAIHLEVFDRPSDMPEMQLDSPWPRRAQGYSRPPAGILKRLNRIRCVPCPGR